MKIHIHPEMTIEAVQAEFTQVFPHLKLVFFNEPHQMFQGSPASEMITDTNRTIGSIEKDPAMGTLTLEADTPTWRAERLFEDRFGLHVQIFRRSGKTWLSTSRTDLLTLEEQNEKGKACTAPLIIPEDKEENDYREQS